MQLSTITQKNIIHSFIKRFLFFNYFSSRRLPDKKKKVDIASLVIYNFEKTIGCLRKTEFDYSPNPWTNCENLHIYLEINNND